MPRITNKLDSSEVNLFTALAHMKEKKPSIENKNEEEINVD